LGQITHTLGLLALPNLYLYVFVMLLFWAK
jgi:hypothetical protein